VPLGEIAQKDNRRCFWNLENAPDSPLAGVPRSFAFLAKGRDD